MGVGVEHYCSTSARLFFRQRGERGYRSTFLALPPLGLSLTDPCSASALPFFWQVVGQVIGVEPSCSTSARSFSGRSLLCFCSAFLPAEGGAGVVVEQSCSTSARPSSWRFLLGLRSACLLAEGWPGWRRSVLALPPSCLSQSDSCSTSALPFLGQRVDQGWR